MMPMAGTETVAVAIVGKALQSKKQEHCGPVGEGSKNMPGRCLYVPMGDILVVDLKLMRISAVRGSCSRANLDERRDMT